MRALQSFLRQSLIRPKLLQHPSSGHFPLQVRNPSFFTFQSSVFGACLGGLRKSRPSLGQSTQTEKTASSAVAKLFGSDGFFPAGIASLCSQNSGIEDGRDDSQGLALVMLLNPGVLGGLESRRSGGLAHSMTGIVSRNFDRPKGIQSGRSGRLPFSVKGGELLGITSRNLGFSKGLKLANEGFFTRAFCAKEVEDEWIQDFNSELEMVFGSQPERPSQLGGGQVFETKLKSASDELSASKSVSFGAQNVSLSHVDAAGKAAMVNVVQKVDSKRVAVAQGKVYLGAEAFNLVAANKISKGDVLTVAKIAGIQGAKQTSSLIPLCHNILISGVDVSLTLDEDEYAVDIRAEATASGPTGVEMEALTAVSVAGLTIYDMCKAVSKEIRICSVQLVSKTGGKSGDWFRNSNDIMEGRQKCN